MIVLGTMEYCINAMHGSAHFAF